MYQLINDNKSLKGQFLYYAVVNPYAPYNNHIQIKKLFIRLDKIYHFIQEINDYRQITYMGGNFKIPLHKLNKQKSFAYKFNEFELIATQKQEIARFIQQQYKKNIITKTYKIILPKTIT